MNFRVIVVLSLFVALSIAQTDLKLELVTRSIDLSTQNAKHHISVAVANGREKLTSLEFVLEESIALHLASLKATSGNTKLTIGEPETKKTGNLSYRSYPVRLANEIPPQGKATIVFDLVFTHLLSPFPTHLQSQSDKQLVKYQGDSVFFLSPYEVTRQSTTVTLASAKIESHTEQTPFNVKGNQITYGEYLDIAPFTHSSLQIHFESNTPFVTITKLVREIEISMWGNAAVEETYEIKHSGAQLTGVFSRFDYQRGPSSAPSVVHVLRSFLPPTASDIYYRDEIGNISTSHVRQESDRVSLELIPRFPLFGGWKTNFYAGYNLPLDKVLGYSSRDGAYLLNASISTDFDFDVVIDELIVRVILPEGATQFKAKTPSGFSVSNDRHWAYLDVLGRPVVTLRTHNAVNSEYFQVTFSYNLYMVLLKVLLLVIAYFTLFLLAIIFVRLEISIVPDSTGEAEKDFSIKSLLEQLQTTHDSLSDLFDNLSQAATSYKASRKAQFKSEQDAIRVQITKHIASLQTIKNQLDDLDEDLGSQAEQIIKKEGVKDGFLKQLIDQEIMYRNKELSTTVYETTKAQFEQNFREASEELERLVAELSSLGQ